MIDAKTGLTPQAVQVEALKLIDQVDSTNHGQARLNELGCSPQDMVDVGWTADISPRYMNPTYKIKTKDMEAMVVAGKDMLQAQQNFITPDRSRVTVELSDTKSSEGVIVSVRHSPSVNAAEVVGITPSPETSVSLYFDSQGNLDTDKVSKLNEKQRDVAKKFLGLPKADMPIQFPDSQNFFLDMIENPDKAFTLPAVEDPEDTK